MKKVLLCVLDGVGLSKIKDGNALINANKPNIDYLMKEYPNKGINASGTFVGLPDGQMGNSEVGHLTIGAGRIIYQSLELINRAIKDESFYSNESFLNAIRHAKENNSKLHIMGLLSDGGVHSHINHIKALLKLCKKEDFSNVYFHIFTDGRDTFKESSISYIDDLNNEINELGIGKICTISGRYYAMDRDKRWDRLKKCYDVIVNNTGNKCDNYKKYITDSYEKGITDEFIEPVIIDESGKIEENDSIIWANFRPDRAIQILRSLVDPDFDGFDRKIFNNLYLTTMMYVSDDVKSDIAFKKEIIDIIRDKKTLFMGIVLPLILYPLLMIIMTQIMTISMNSIENDDINIAFEKYPSKELITLIKNYDSDGAINIVKSKNYKKYL